MVALGIGESRVPDLSRGQKPLKSVQLGIGKLDEIGSFLKSLLIFLCCRYLIRSVERCGLASHDWNHQVVELRRAYPWHKGSLTYIVLPWVHGWSPFPVVFLLWLNGRNNLLMIPNQDRHLPLINVSSVFAMAITLSFMVLLGLK